VNRNYSFLIGIGQQACLFAGQICVRLSACSASVAVKLSAVNRSTNLRTSLYSAKIVRYASPHFGAFSSLQLLCPS
jgi:hypothetical protein